jgi:HAD superfamily hydrolase (TIGR01484 family)
MRFSVLACDYDGTLAHDGRVNADTVSALKQWIACGGRLVLVTGRELSELLPLFPEVLLCEWVVAENGAVLYHPQTESETLLAEAPPRSFLNSLRNRGVERISAGRVIVATWEPHSRTVAELIHEQQLPFRVILNKGAVMVLPAGVDKASGLTQALQNMAQTAANTVAVGDAENDVAMFDLCGFSVAVSNALPAVAAKADLVTVGHHGVGVVELIHRLLRTESQAVLSSS